MNLFPFFSVIWTHFYVYCKLPWFWKPKGTEGAWGHFERNCFASRTTSVASLFPVCEMCLCLKVWFLSGKSCGGISVCRLFPGCGVRLNLWKLRIVSLGCCRWKCRSARTGPTSCRWAHQPEGWWDASLYSRSKRVCPYSFHHLPINCFQSMMAALREYNQPHTSEDQWTCKSLFYSSLWTPISLLQTSAACTSPSLASTLFWALKRSLCRSWSQAI